MSDPKAYPLACPDRQTWTARLDAKAWGRSSNLMLYLTDIDTGARLRVSVWHLNSYRARNGRGPDFHHEAQVGDTFELQTVMTRSGTPNLLRAVKS
jgi:hypothetical protein